MNADSVNRWLTLAANLGVIVGIVFLALEVNQNNQMMLSQTRNAMSEEATNILFTLTTDKETSEFWESCSSKGLTFPSEAENNRCLKLAAAQIRYDENAYFQYQMGLYEQSEYLAHRQTWKEGLYIQKGMVETFCLYRDFWSPAFANEIESLLSTYQCSNNN